MTAPEPLATATKFEVVAGGTVLTVTRVEAGWLVEPAHAPFIKAFQLTYAYREEALEMARLAAGYIEQAALVIDEHLEALHDDLAGIASGALPAPQLDVDRFAAYYPAGG